MTRNLDRLRKGERWWTAEFVLRLSGMVLLTAANRLGDVAHRWVMTPPPHQATPGEFAVSLGIVVCLTCGLALTMFGPKLFEHVPIPKKSPLYGKS